MLHKYKNGELASRANKFYSLEIWNEDSSDEDEEVLDTPDNLDENEDEDEDENEHEDEDENINQRICVEPAEDD